MLRGPGPPCRELVEQRSVLGGRARRPSSRSGRRSRVRRSACARRHRAMRAWSPRAQHLGHRPAPELARAACTAGTRAGRRRTTRRPPTPRCPSRPGTQPGHRLDHDERGRLAAGEHVVADRQLAVAEVVGDPLVDALVAAAQQREAAAGRRARAAIAWSKRRPLGRQQEQRARRLRPPRPRRTAAPASSPCPAPPPNGVSSTLRCRSVVCVARVVHAHVEQTRGARPAEQRQRRAAPSRYSGKIVKTSMRTVTLTGRRRAGRRAGRRRRRPGACSTTNTIGTSAPPSSTSRSCAGFASTAIDAAERVPGAVAHLARRSARAPTARRRGASRERVAR